MELQAAVCKTPSREHTYKRHSIATIHTDLFLCLAVYCLQVLKEGKVYAHTEENIKVSSTMLAPKE